MKKLVFIIALVLPLISFGGIDLDTPQGRKNWWKNLGEDWHRFFVSGYFYDASITDPTDAQLVDLLATKSISLDNDDECGLGPMYDADVSDLTGLKHLKHLEELSLSFCKFNNFEPLVHLKGLKRIYLNYAEFESWDGFEQLTALTTFETTNSDPALLTRVNKLSQLKVLRLHRGTNVDVDLKKISDLNNLEVLHLMEYANANDNLLDGIEAFPNLKMLNITQPGSYLDFRRLAGLRSLEKLVIENTRFEYLETLKNSEVLQYIQLTIWEQDMRGEQITLNDFGKLPNLWYLEINGYEVANPEAVNRFELMQHLNLSSSDTFDMSWIANCNHLSNLEIRTQQFLNLNDLKELPKLNSLRLHSNSLTSIAELPVLEDVYYFQLSSRNLTTLEGIEKWSSLNAITVQKCPKLNVFQSLRKLRELRRISVSDDHYETVLKLFDGYDVEVYGEMIDVGGC